MSQGRGIGRDSEELPPVDVRPDFTTEEIMKAKTVVTVVERPVSEPETDDDKSSTMTKPPLYAETEIGSQHRTEGGGPTRAHVS